MEELGTTPLQQMAASSSGAFIASFLVTPLDVIKVRLQSQHCGQGMINRMTCTCVKSVSQRVPCPYARSGPQICNGTWDAILKITRSEGVAGLWSGLSPTLVMAIPATICYYTLYDNLRIRIKYRFGPERSSEASMVAGVCARLSILILVSPMEMVRTKIQFQNLKYFELLRAMQSATANEGYGALYKGYTATLLRDLPFSAIIWYYYDYFKRQFASRYNVPQHNPVVCFSAAGLAGSLAALATMPFDVVKTQREVKAGQMISPINTRTVMKVANYSTTWHVFRTIVKEHGVVGLYAGTFPRVIQVAPACAIMIGSYEVMKNYFQQLNERRNGAIQNSTL